MGHEMAGWLQPGDVRTRLVRGVPITLRRNHYGSPGLRIARAGGDEVNPISKREAMIRSLRHCLKLRPYVSEGYSTVAALELGDIARNTLYGMSDLCNELLDENLPELEGFVPNWVVAVDVKARTLALPLACQDRVVSALLVRTPAGAASHMEASNRARWPVEDLCPTPEGRLTLI